MSKEDGMKKLLELLNKHRVELAHGNLQNQLMRHYNGYVFGLGDLNSLNCVLLIISKEYGFIKWLVENEKIDYHKISDIMIYSQWRYTGINKTTAQRVDENMSDLLLMLLSIQDEPIEFLISILKNVEKSD